MYSDMLGIGTTNPSKCRKRAVLGRVAKKQRGKRQTFLQQNIPGSIDTFRVSMLKYYEEIANTKRRQHHAEKRDVHQTEQAVRIRFCRGFVVSFFCRMSFSLCGEKFFFARKPESRTRQTQIRRELRCCL